MMAEFHDWDIVPLSKLDRFQIGDLVRVPASAVVSDRPAEIVSIIKKRGETRYRLRYPDGTTTVATPDMLVAHHGDWEKT